MLSDIMLTGDKINQAGRSVSDTVSGKVSEDVCTDALATPQEFSPPHLES